MYFFLKQIQKYFFLVTFGHFGNLKLDVTSEKKMGFELVAKKLLCDTFIRCPAQLMLRQNCGWPGVKKVE